MKKIFALCLVAILEIAFSPPGNTAPVIQKEYSYIVFNPAVTSVEVSPVNVFDNHYQLSEFLSRNYVQFNFAESSQNLNYSYAEDPPVPTLKYLMTLEVSNSYNIQKEQLYTNNKNWLVCDNQNEYRSSYSARDWVIPVNMYIRT